MKGNKALRALSGIFSVLPLICVLVFIGLFAAVSAGGASAEMRSAAMTVAVIFVVVWLIDYVWFIIDAWRLRDANGRAIWIFAFLLLSVFAYPVYWFKYCR